MEKTACFTGHRLAKLGGYNETNPVAIRVKAELLKAVEEAVASGYNHFISGGAIGVDQWAIEIVLGLKMKHPHLKLTVARPFPSQDKIWPEATRKKFQELCSRADEVVDVSADPFSGWKMQVRNEYMVNASSLVIAVWDGTSGGTANAVKYAQKKNKTIVRITP